MFYSNKDTRLSHADVLLFTFINDCLQCFRTEACVSLSSESKLKRLSASAATRRLEITCFSIQQRDESSFNQGLDPFTFESVIFETKIT
jgi:hypothetical protein